MSGTRLAAGLSAELDEPPLSVGPGPATTGSSEIKVENDYDVLEV